MAMNIIQLQDNLKNLSDQQLAQAMQMPAQDTPPFLVVSELNRRKKMRDNFQAQQASQNQTTVAQDVVAAAGVPQQAATDMAQSLAPQTDMANNTGIMSIPKGGEPQRMAAGGIVKMAEGGGTAKAMPYMPRTSAVLTDPILITMASRKGMSVNDYLQAMSPEERNLVESQSAARANRDRYATLEPATDTYNSITAVNPSYEEQLTSVFPPDPEPVRNRPNFEDFGRDSRPTYEERSYAGRLPSFDDLILRNELERSANTNAVRPEYVSGYAPDTAQLPFALPDAGQAAASREALGNAVQGTRAGPQTGMPKELSIAEQMASLPGMDQYAAREDLAYNVQNDRAGTQTVPQMAATLRLGPGPNRSGLNLTDKPYDMGPNNLPDILSSTVKIDSKGNVVVVPPSTPDAIPLPHPGQTGDAAAKVVAAKQAAAAKTAADAAKGGAGSGGTGGSGGSGGAGGSGKPSTYEQMLMDAMTNADKKAKQDKWLAVAQMGLALMSSAQPNIGMALGEAGAKGIEALQGARDKATAEKLGLSKELYGIDLMRQKMAASSAAAAAKAKGSGLTANQTVTAAAAAVKNAEGRLTLLGINPTTDLSTLTPEARLAAQTAINDYNRTYSDYQSILAAVNSGGISAVPSGASEDPTAPDNVSD